MIKWAMTASKSKDVLEPEMLAFCQAHHIPVLARQNKSIAYLLQHHELEYLLVLEDGELVAYSLDNRLVFHPGMAAPRIKQWNQGVGETLMTALALSPGGRFLDCTMGLASDALAASAMVGESGQVICLESSPLIYIITKYGLAHSTKGSLQLQAAMRRIQPYQGDFHEVLPTLADNSFDVVYFDPMFVRPLQKSSGIAGLRAAADYYQPTAEDFNQAKRVAAQRVVVKHGKGQMAQTAFDEVICGRYSTIGYGLFYAEKGGGQ